MRLYQATSFIFPRSFHLRIFCLCFLATHLPLLAVLLWQLQRGEVDWQTILVAVLATLVSTAVAIGGIAGLLSPLVHATRALNRIEHRERVEELAPGGPDIVGALIHSVNTAARASHLLISHLEDAAYRDALTGLLNRRGLFEQADAVLVRHGFSALALIDLDHFKAINDRLGHAAGDRVLETFAKVLRHNVRETDMIARWGGEEFIMLFPSTDGEAARVLIERIAEAFTRTTVAHFDGEHITFSAGITSFVGGQQELKNAFDQTDRALYAAKSGGRNRVVLEEPF